MTYYSVCTGYFRTIKCVRDDNLETCRGYRVTIPTNFSCMVTIDDR